MKRVNMSGLVVVRPEHKTPEDMYILTVEEMESLMITIAALREKARNAGALLQTVAAELEQMTPEQLASRIGDLSHTLLSGLK